jgi:hypothetical protein
VSHCGVSGPPVSSFAMPVSRFSNLFFICLY